MNIQEIFQNIFYANITLHEGTAVEKTITVFQPVLVWIWLELLIILWIIFAFKKFPKSSFVLLFDLIYEKVYDFFEDLLGKEEKKLDKNVCNNSIFYNTYI